MVPAGMCGKGMSSEDFRGKLLSRGRFVPYRADHRLGTSILQPSCNKCHHEKGRHLHRRAQSIRQESCRIMVGRHEK